MPFCLVIVRGYWGVFATTFLIRLAYVTLVLTLCSTASTIVAHEKEGFVVLPNQAPASRGLSGVRRILPRSSPHTSKQAARLGYGGTRKSWRGDRPCTFTAQRM